MDKQEYHEMCQQMQNEDIKESLLNDMKNAKTNREKIYYANLILDLKEGKDILPKLLSKSPQKHAQTGGDLSSSR